MKIVVLHNEVSDQASPADVDVLAQRDAVTASLDNRGHRTFVLPCTLDLASLQHELQELEPDAVFNLVESMGGTDRLMPLATLLLDGMEISYTGSNTLTLLSTVNKLAAKGRLRAAGLPTPDWLENGGNTRLPVFETSGREESQVSSGQWIIKPVWEHASFGMDDESVVVPNSAADLLRLLTKRQHRLGKPCFAERFVQGREFNLSLLAGIDQVGNGVVSVLPPAEIQFNSFPSGKPHIVGYRAKWERESFEYEQTPRCFTFPPTDEAMLGELAELARQCWELFGMRGYARVDFRVDECGRPWILEVNANPCLSPDAGFSAAVLHANIAYDEAVERIVDVAHAGIVPYGKWTPTTKRSRPSAAPSNSSHQRN